MHDGSNIPRGSKHRQLRQRLRGHRIEGPRRRIPRVAVPSFFTLLNLFSGFLAIVQIHEEQYQYACYFIVLAGFFDLLDGMLARLANAQSLFGTELDSLSDVVSFGVAPAYLVYAYSLSEFGVFGLLTSALPALCAAVRLARFNVLFDGTRREYYQGLPAPAQALAIVSLVLNGEIAGRLYPLAGQDQSLLMPIIFLLSLLMLTSIRFEAVPRPSTQFIQRNPYLAAGYLVAALLLLILQQAGFLIVITAYILFGLVRAGMKAARAVFDNQGLGKHD